MGASVEAGDTEVSFLTQSPINGRFPLVCGDLTIAVRPGTAEIDLFIKSGRGRCNGVDMSCWWHILVEHIDVVVFGATSDMLPVRRDGHRTHSAPGFVTP